VGFFLTSLTRRCSLNPFGKGEKMAGKKEISAALFSFIYDNFLLTTPTPIIKSALKKVGQLIATLEDEKEETVPMAIVTPSATTPISISEMAKVIVDKTPPVVEIVEQKKQRASRKDKGILRKNGTANS
jgi:hypothetical protein